MEANYQVALVHKEMKKLEEARRHIKRIVIWKNTPKKVKDLYKELLNNDPKFQELDDVRLQVYSP